MSKTLSRCYFLLLFIVGHPIHSSTSEASLQIQELDELKMEIEFLKQFLLHQLSPVPDLSPSFHSLQTPRTQLEENIEPTSTLWTTSLYTSVDTSTIIIPTTTIVPINIGGLAGRTYTVVDTVTSLLASTATLTTSVRISPTSSIAQTPSTTSMRISPTSSLAQTASTSTLSEARRKSSTFGETFNFSSRGDFTLPSRKFNDFSSRKTKKYSFRKSSNFPSTQGFNIPSRFDSRNNQTRTEFAALPTQNSKLRNSTPKSTKLQPKSTKLQQSRLSIFDPSNRTSLVKVSAKLSKPRRVQLVSS